MAITSCDPVVLALRAAQDVALATLRDTCTVVRKSSTANRIETEYGYEYPENRVSYACSVLAHTGAKEVVTADKAVSTYDTTILLPLSALVGPADRIETAGNRYEIIATDQGRTGALVIRCAARKVA